MENLVKYIHALSDLSLAGWEILQPALREQSYKKGAYLLQEGTVCNSLFFIDKGYCRSSYLLNGVEKNTAFFFEHEIATNLTSFGSGQKSAYSIIAGEALTAIVFDKQELALAAQRAPEIEALGRNCIRQFASRQDEFANLFKLFTAKERLIYLEENHPEMLRRVSLTQLSSFLGVARETLSRIRRRRMKQPAL